MPKILVVDDDPDFVEWVKFVLADQGYDIVSAADGEQGLGMVGEQSPDLVILDIMMSTVLDGLRMSQEMRENVAFRQIPVLMVTSIANTDYAELFPTDEYVHIDDFLSKPIPPEVLRERVSTLLG